MAVKIKDIYPSQTDGGDAGWPDGKPRNVQGDIQGTGTPFEEKLFQDYEGARQALFSESGVNPSGQPDNVNNSDFVEALRLLTKPASSVVTDDNETLQEYKDSGYSGQFILQDGTVITVTNGLITSVV